MWQSPNQKVQRGGPKKGRGQPRASLHVKRVTAEIHSAKDHALEGRPEVRASARILLNDLSARGVGVYCDKPFIAGQEVAIALTISGTIYLRCLVLYCKEQDEKNHVISDTPFYYRLGLKFMFASAAEEAEMNKYCEQTLQALYNPAA
jgi:hypothetical protein